jgi:hypothetical protein
MGMTRKLPRSRKDLFSGFLINCRAGAYPGIDGSGAGDVWIDVETGRGG